MMFEARGKSVWSVIEVVVTILYSMTGQPPFDVENSGIINPAGLGKIPTIASWTGFKVVGSSLMTPDDGPHADT